MSKKKEKTLNEKIDDIVDGHYLQKTTCENMAQQIISIVRADERERILEEIESKEYFTPKDMNYIRKLLRPESDTEGK